MLKASNAVDFDDLILLVLRLFAEHPGRSTNAASVIATSWWTSIRTPTIAVRAVHSLAGEHRNFCVVGDDDQSI
ncbi:MAG: hypothetical protein CM1200mP29_03680 [Verrucomicrobiota bacterium]|nr:MAG: hypothetical protein CM1200mP29_03680 [Verrucomicrobiota bacterium]